MDSSTESSSSLIEGRVIFIADFPTYQRSVSRSHQGFVELVARVLEACPRGSLSVVDRDRTPASGGTEDRMRLERLFALRHLTHQHQAGLLLSGRPDLAHVVEADGVQLAEHGLSVEAVRSSFPTLALGRSCHDRMGLEKAEADGADWAFLSPVYTPRSKGSALQPLGIEAFRLLTGHMSIPVVALGGVDCESSPELRRAGATAVACIGAILLASDPAASAYALVASFGAYDGPGLPI